MPGRVGSPTVGDLGVAGEQAVDQRAVGGRRRGAPPAPAGLSTTITSSSSWTTGTVDRRIGLRAGAASTTSAPARPRSRRLRRVEPVGAASWPPAPSTRDRSRRRPGAAASARLTPVSMATDPVDALAGRARRGPRRHDRGLVGRARSGPARKLTTTSRMPPTTMAASATLKTGHHCRSMKSTTAPCRKPVVAAEGPVDRGCRRRRRRSGPTATAPSAEPAGGAERAGRPPRRWRAPRSAGRGPSPCRG